MSENFPAAPLNPTKTESIRSPETEPFREGLVGLQVRLQMQGETLNPQNLTVPEVTRDQLGDPNNRQTDFFTVFNEASTKERVAQTMTKAEWIADTDQLLGKDIHTDKIQKLSFLPTTDAAQLYERYFKGSGSPVEVVMGNGTRKLVPANVKQFVDDVLVVMKKDDTVDYNKLQDAINEIQWFANMFGAQSAQIITQLIDAEAKLLTKPQEYVDAANAASGDTTRRNDLDEKEVELLTFLYTGEPARPTPKPTTPSPIRTKPDKWKYSRLTDPRVYPAEYLRSVLSNPSFIARELQKNYPDEYGRLSKEELVEQIIQEEEEAQQYRNQLGLSEEKISELFPSTLTKYGTFLKDTYGIKIPQIESIPFILLHKSTSRLYNPKKNSFGFVHEGVPAIYADFDVIEQKAIQMGRHIYNLSDAEKGILIKRLLEEINPHEYTHLIAETAYWHKGDRLPITIDEQRAATTMEGRLGIAVESPGKNERGGPLMEAVTVELTDRWAKSINGKLDIDAYRGERDVLDALILQLRVDNPALSDHDAFVPFVKAYFEQHGFRDLAEALSGKYSDAQGKIHFKRPHHMSIIYELMNFEHDKQAQNHRYPLTLAFINGNLTDAQKTQILALPLSVASKKAFAAQLDIDFTPPPRPEPELTPSLIMPDPTPKISQPEATSIIPPSVDNTNSRVKTPQPEIVVSDPLLNEIAEAINNQGEFSRELKSGEVETIMRRVINELIASQKPKSGQDKVEATLPELKVDIKSNGHGIVNGKVQINKPIDLGINVDFELANHSDDKTKLTLISQQVRGAGLTGPAKLLGVKVKEGIDIPNIAQKVLSQPNQALFRALQGQLVSRGITLFEPDMSLQFTTDGRLAIKLKGQSK